MNARQSVVGFDFQRYNQEYLARSSTRATGSNGHTGTGETGAGRDAANDARQYDVRIVPAQVTPGQLYWRVIGVRHLSPAENTGKHNLYADLLDEEGKRVRDPRFQLQRGWEGQRADESAPPVNFDKGDNEPATNVPIDRNQKLWVRVSGDLPSDKVENLHTKHADEPGPNGELWNSIGHHSFYVVFQRTRQAAAPVPATPGSPGTTPEPPLDKHDDQRDESRDDDASYVEGRDAIAALAVMQPGQRFDQVWHVRNTGSSHWQENYHLMCVGGEPLGAPAAVPILPCAPDHEIALIVPFVAPTAAGAHYSVWRIFNERGEPFGERLWLLIEVAQREGLRSRNARPVAPSPAPSQPAPAQPTRRLPEPTAGAIRDPELYAAWKHHIEQGFANNQMMFEQLLNGFLNPYWTTVWMYRILFGLGVASFLVAAGLSAFGGKEGYTLVFGGISALSLLAYFFNRPLQALEENLQFITWLGLIYNSYWTRLVYLNALPDVQQGLQDATDDAIQRIKELMAAHDKHAAARPALPEEPSIPQPPTG